jgi:hypothetical protein
MVRNCITENFPDCRSFLDVDYAGSNHFRRICIRLAEGCPVPITSFFDLKFPSGTLTPHFEDVKNSSFSVVVSLPLRYDDQELFDLIHPMPASVFRWQKTRKDQPPEAMRQVQLNFADLKTQAVVCSKGFYFNVVTFLRAKFALSSPFLHVTRKTGLLLSPERKICFGLLHPQFPIQKYLN